MESLELMRNKMLAAGFVKLKILPENLFPNSPLFKPKTLG
jgi:hypothetical protein